MVLRSRRPIQPVWTHPHHPGSQCVDLKTQVFEHISHQVVVLVAVAAAAPADELVLEGVDVEPDAPAEEDVEVLEGDGEGVGAMQPAQPLRRRRGRRIEADPSQVGVEVEALDLPLRRHPRRGHGSDCARSAPRRHRGERLGEVGRPAAEGEPDPSGDAEEGAGDGGDPGAAAQPLQA
jgi:hypothetical protein